MPSAETRPTPRSPVAVFGTSRRWPSDASGEGTCAIAVPRARDGRLHADGDRRVAPAAFEPAAAVPGLRPASCMRPVRAICGAWWTGSRPKSASCWRWKNRRRRCERKSPGCFSGRRVDAPERTPPRWHPPLVCALSSRAWLLDEGGATPFGAGPAPKDAVSRIPRNRAGRGIVRRLAARRNRSRTPGPWGGRLGWFLSGVDLPLVLASFAEIEQ